VSHSTRRDIESFLQIPTDRIRTIYSAPDPSFTIDPPDTTQDQQILQRYSIQPPFILYAGTIRPQKNVPRLVEAFAVIRDAMTRKKMVGIGRVVLARRERMLMLQPRGPGMLATTLRYPYEVRQDSEYFSDIHDVKLSAEMLDIAQEIIARKSSHFEPDKFTDRYEETVVEMLRAKQAGQAFTTPQLAEPGNVVDIMEALKRSLRASGGESGAARRPPAPSKKPAAAPVKAAPKAKARKAAR